MSNTGFYFLWAVFRAAMATHTVMALVRRLSLCDWNGVRHWRNLVVSDLERQCGAPCDLLFLGAATVKWGLSQ